MIVAGETAAYHRLWAPELVWQSGATHVPQDKSDVAVPCFNRKQGRRTLLIEFLSGGGGLCNVAMREVPHTLRY